MINSANNKHTHITFVIIWSVLSLFGMLIFPYNLSLFSTFFLLGFHIPRDCLYFFFGYGLFSDYPQLGLLFLLILGTFVVTWIIALFRLNKSKLFEYLIWIDCACSLLVYLLAVMLLENINITIYAPLARLLIENIIIIVIKLNAKKTDRNTGDGSLS